MAYSIENVATLIGAHRYVTVDAQIDWLLTDSRSLAFPETTLFFALRTRTGDGHRYVDDLYRRGVRNFVVSAVHGKNAVSTRPTMVMRCSDIPRASRRAR